MADDDTREDDDEGAASRPSDPLFPDELSNIRSVDDTGSTSLTSLLAKPVPRKHTPVPAEPPHSSEVKPPEPREVEPPSAEASSTPTPPAPSHREADPIDERRAARERRVPVGLALAAALATGLGVAWMTSDSTEVDTEEGESGTEVESRTQTAPLDHLDERSDIEGPGPDTRREPTAAVIAPVSTSNAADPAADLAPLAVLPVTPPEILSQNTWARRNRAAEVRAEARVLYGTQQWEPAREKLLLSLQWDPSNADAQRNVSRTFQQEHEMEAALSWSRRAVATDASDPRSYELLGDQLLMMGHEGEALAAYRAGLDAAPEDARLKVRIRRLAGDLP